MPTNQDLDNRTDSYISLAPVSVTSNTTRNGTGIDTANAVSVTFVFTAGGVTDGTYTNHIEESDDNSTFTDVATDRLTGTLTALSAGNLIDKVGVHPTKKYVRAVSVSTGTTSGAHSIGANVIIQNS